MKLSPYCHKLFHFLAGDTSHDEKAHEQDWIAHIDEHRRGLDMSNLFRPTIDFLQQRRASISCSLMRSTRAVLQWNAGQALVNQWLKAGRSLTLDDVMALNKVVAGTPHIGLRSCDMYTTLVRHVAPHELRTMMRAFFSHLTTTISSKHALYAAFVCRYWLLSIHPFFEANGRTSQLLADYFLLEQGYPPQAFYSKLEGNLIGEPEAKPYMTPHEAFRRFCQTVLNAYKILKEAPKKELKISRYC